MLLGFGTKAAATIAVFHIMNQATLKAAPFMAASNVDYTAHTRDLRRLGGLRHLMPITFGVALFASLSMAGIPPLNNFRLLAHGFLGPLRDDCPHKPHDPGPGFRSAPAFLALLVTRIGLFPMLTAAWLVDAAASAVTGEVVEVHISLFTGWDRKYSGCPWRPSASARCCRAATICR